jgi:bacillithiol biosynthesis cysteine-adding enzyme BshC
VKQETARQNGNIILRTKSLSFADIPGQTRLFTDYQQDPLKLSEFYPSAVGSHTGVAGRVPGVLAAYETDRNALCDALNEINRNCGAGEKTFENIALLRRADCVAVVTGQQAGLFTGPLYTIYKALSVIKMTECLRNGGITAVPVFWTASEDHDFEEVSNAFALNAQGELVEVKAAPGPLPEGLPVGYVKLDGSIAKTIDDLLGELPVTDFTAELRVALSEAWSEGAGYAEAFSGLLSRILRKYGLVILDPLHPRMKRLAAPVYRNAVERSAEIVSALIERDKKLKTAGYHSQVLVEEDYFPLFLHAQDGTRHSLRKTKNGRLRTKDGSAEFAVEELAEMAAVEPERFSPTVVLRPVVQDYLLPTACYFGGGAEIAYFAQNSVVYGALGRPVTTVLHRQSFTVVAAKHARTMEKYGIEFTGLFEGEEKVMALVVEKFLNPETARVFTETEEKINTELDRLDRILSEFDPTLADNLATRRRKIVYHIGALRKKFYYSQARRDEVVHRRIETLFMALLPNRNLQERAVNITGFLNLYGPYFIDWVYDAIDLDDKGHRLIYL